MSDAHIHLPRFFQANCRNLGCPDTVMFDFTVTVERGGLRCKRCGELNEYNWSDAEYLDTRRAYGQEESAS